MVAELVSRQGGSPVNGETPGTSPSSGSQGGPQTPSILARNPAMFCSGPPQPQGPQPPQGPQQHLMQMSPPSRSQSPDTNSYPQRKQREFIPDNKKDDSYWDRRRRNNEAAKRSREKRRFNDMILERRVVELSKENHVLKAQLTAIRDKYGISGESVLSVEQVLASLPSSDQVLGQAKRPKLTHPPSPQMPVPHQMHHHHLHHPAAPMTPTPHQPLPHQPLPHQSLTSPSPHPHPQPQQPSPSPIPTSVIHQPVAHGQRSPPPLLGFVPHQPLEEHNKYPEQEYPAYPYPLPLPPLYPSGAALNLSRGAREERSLERLERLERASSPYELSSGSGDEATLHPPTNNNCLPHKLRHKSHLGEKEAAGALLSLQALQAIKSEGAHEGAHEAAVDSARASPPWDAEGSSDERDSGISLGDCGYGAGEARHEAQDDTHLKSELARLASEVASLKSMLHKGSSLPSLPPLPQLQQPHVALL